MNYNGSHPSVVWHYCWVQYTIIATVCDWSHYDNSLRKYHSFLQHYTVSIITIHNNT